MKFRLLFAAAAVVVLTACSTADTVLSGHRNVTQLAPTGKLRTGIVLSSFPSAFTAGRDPSSGRLRGEPVDLAVRFGSELGVPVMLITYDSPDALLRGATADSLDLAFMPYDAERARVMAFGPAYAQLGYTFLVPAASAFNGLADMDRPGIRIAVQEGSIAQARLQQELKYATLVSRPDVRGLGDALRGGQADALAHERALLTALASELPGTKVLDGSFVTAPLAIAVSSGRPAALAYASRFIRRVSAADTVQQTAGAVRTGDRMAAQ